MKRFPVVLLSLIFLPAAALAQTRAVIDPTPLKAADAATIAQILVAPESVVSQPAPILAPTPTAPALPAPVRPPPALEDVQGLVESAADAAPSAVQPYLKMIASAIGGALVLFGIQKAAQSLKRKGTKPCSTCQGTGREHASGTCATCHGTRQVEKEYEPKMDCAHCDGEGHEPCESCEGKGCAACKETGQERDGENKMIDCKVCKGEGELSVKVKRNVVCPDCH